MLQHRDVFFNGWSLSWYCSSSSSAKYDTAPCALEIVNNFPFRDRSQTLVRGPDAKRGPLKFLTLVRGALKKITTDFPLKIKFTCFSMGLTRNFHGKKRGPDFFFFFFFFCGLNGGPEKFSR